jgi:hypothetical protein
MTRGRRKHWHVRLAFEPNRFASEQLQKTYEQLRPIQARTTAQAPGAKHVSPKRTATTRGKR